MLTVLIYILDTKELNAKWRDEEKNERENYKQNYKQSSITTRRKQLPTYCEETYYKFVCFFSCIRHDLSITYILRKLHFWRIDSATTEVVINAKIWTYRATW